MGNLCLVPYFRSRVMFKMSFWSRQLHGWASVRRGRIARNPFRTSLTCQRLQRELAEALEFASQVRIPSPRFITTRHVAELIMKIRNSLLDDNWECHSSCAVRACASAGDEVTATRDAGGAPAAAVPKKLTDGLSSGAVAGTPDTST